MHAAAVGFGLGFFVALQLGPMSLFLIRSTLRSGWGVGLAIGAGIACVDGLYAAAGAGGATPLLSIQPVRLALGLLGAAVLIALGTRTLYTAVRVRVGTETPLDVATPRRALLTALAGTASNPSTIVSWGAIFAAASTAGLVHTTATAALLVGGVAVGSLTWVTILATGVAIAGRSMNSRTVRVVDGIAALAYTTTHER
jgi:putative LysE/RhtB family amino acid efflux pump